MDTNTGNSCSDTDSDSTSICDSIYTAINASGWTDDYITNTNPYAPGWTVRDFDGNIIADTFTGDESTYHGPYYGDPDTQNIEVYTLRRYFYCEYDASVAVHFYFGYSCQENTDFCRLYLNDALKAEKDSPVTSGQDFKDQTLEDEVYAQSECGDAWHRKPLNGTLESVSAHSLFAVTIEIGLNFEKEASVINDLEIVCSPQIITDAPTMDPTTDPSVDPTSDPTTSPITAAPTGPPTANPSAVPTMHPVMTTDTPTMPSLEPTAYPTSAAPTDPPSVSPTDVPTGNPSLF